jgi:hypothetical protein
VYVGRGSGGMPTMTDARGWLLVRVAALVRVAPFG